ncbi:ATP-binding cassette domain-containing protein [Cohnella cholangitidis]|uniref:ATP-binding cassette domain-containing protein n=1 Tax=Cohnella cholangitidis TaxID=2598458 RepID=UPI001C710BAC|nr:ATP-binding cassette domain-containing protein [Cohnella cholangitidis]
MALSISTDSRADRSPSAEAETLIALRDLSLSYRSGSQNKQVLERIDLTIREHEFVAVLGSSGCGKTSLLRLLAGYEQPTDGSFNVLGRAHSSPNAEVGVVFQHANLFPWLNVQRNVEFGLKMKRVPKQLRNGIASEIIAQVGLGPYAQYLPSSCPEE